MTDVHPIFKGLPIKMVWCLMATIANDLSILIDQLGLSIIDIRIVLITEDLFQGIGSKKLIPRIQEQHIVTSSQSQTLVHGIIDPIILLRYQNIDRFFILGN